MSDPYRAAFEQVCARMYRDLHFDASESAAPKDERWARTISGFCDFVETLAEQAEAAEPSPVTTAEQLRALPVGTVLLAPTEEKHDGDDDEPHCCEDWDELSSHYHCARCHDRCSMMGHLNQDGTFSCG